MPGRVQHLKIFCRGHQSRKCEDLWRRQCYGFKDACLEGMEGEAGAPEPGDQLLCSLWLSKCRPASNYVSDIKCF